MPDASETDVDAAVAAARTAFDEVGGWSQWEPGRRREALDRFAVALEKRGADTAEAVTRQNGMPIGISSTFESALSPWRCATTRGWRTSRAWRSCARA